MDLNEFKRIADAAGGFRSESRIRFDGGDPLFPSPMCLATGMGSALGMVGSAIDDIVVLRGGDRQDISIDLTHAGLFMSSMWLLKIDGIPATQKNDRAPLPAEGLFRCRDGRWISISCVFPSLTNGTLAVLHCEPERSKVAEAISTWNSFELEDALTAKDLSGVVVRDQAEWLLHPQGKALKDRPVVELERIGDAPVTPLPDGNAPLEGLRVLDSTRVLAGPAISRTLAEFGADVLHIGSPSLPDLFSAQIDTGHGKRRAHLDLAVGEDDRKLRQLICEGDIFSQSYRTGHLARRGFAPEDIARMKPGAIYVSVNCYGHDGPWQAKRGYDSNARAASGLLLMHEKLAQAEPLERLQYAMLDYATGCWGAFGVLEALKKRAEFGGSWHVKVSLNQTAQWFLRLGVPYDPRNAADRQTLQEAFSRYSETCESSYGELERLKPVIGMSATPPRWIGPTLKPGESVPSWTR